MTPTAPQEWRRGLLPLPATLRDAIASLNDSALQIVLVVNPDETLVGTVTDGDIRRGLLRGFDINPPVTAIVQREPLVVPQTIDRESALQLMQANHIRHLPVVDPQKRVVGLHCWEDLAAPPERANQMVIMAGGRGQRLLPYTEECPKPLVPVGGKPMMEHIIERARAEGFRRFTVSIHFLGHMIREYFGDGSRWQVEIDYLVEDAPLGTAGALALLSPRPSLPLVVTNGDVLTDIRYSELLRFHSHHRAAATMAVRRHEWQHPFGVVRTEGVDITGFDEKPVSHSQINAGIYALEPGAMDRLMVGEPCDMPTLFMRLQETGARTIVYPMHEPWLDVGREDDLHRASRVLALNQQA